ncbi:hypothetical protein C8E01_104231 [Pontibacter virosus]|uniref:Uncharacterized protein n=1 Tax=Pontibacter virosus TaxID=1765052 RepID=A0A2U1AZJ4_9BACT|nr:hypothetical protein C8E01_104231 [Pontibacter virosus]
MPFTTLYRTAHRISVPTPYLLKLQSAMRFAYRFSLLRIIFTKLAAYRLSYQKLSLAHIR